MHLWVDNILKVSFHQQVETIGDAYVVASGKRCEKNVFLWRCYYSNTIDFNPMKLKVHKCSNERSLLQ